MKLHSCRALTVSLMLICLPATAADTYQLAIPAQPLARALQTLATQSGLSLVHYAKVTEAKMAPALEGTFTSEEALTRLLEGSGLKYALVNERTIEIRPASENKRPEARKISDANAGRWNDSIVLAQAETRESPAATPVAAKPSEPEAAVTIEDVIVTATRRAQSVQDVPVSITAISSAEIDVRGLKGMGDYLSAVPGVSFIESNSTSHSVVVRGISTSPISENFGAGTTVATYFGETPITNSAGLLGGSGVDIKLSDIERIEVLRGPQGTAFGNSSLGGAVRTIPTAPRLDDFGGKLLANYSQTGRNGSANHMLQGVFNAPLIQDRLAVRVVGFKYDNSGIYKNVAGTEPMLQAYAASLGPQAVSLATNSDDMGSDKHVGGRAALLFQATDALKLSLSYLYQESEQDGGSFSNGFGDGYGYSSFKINPSRGLRGGQDAAIDNHIGITNLTLEYAFGWADLVATASRVDSETQWSFGAGLDAPYDNTARSPHEALTGELRLVSKLQGPLQFIAGYFHEDLDDTDSEDYGSLEVPALNPFGDGVNSILGTYVTVRDLKQDALFAEVSYDLLENLTLSVGARAYEFSRGNRTEQAGWFFDTALDEPAISVINIKQSGENFKANLSYKPTSNSLLYAGWSQGFRLGRPAVGLLPGICDTNNDGIVDGTNISLASTRMIDSDTLDNIEVGGKVTLLGGRLALDTSVYRIEWEGLPTNAIATCGAASYGYVANAGEARSQGFEFQSSYRVTRGLRVDFGGSYTDAELTANVPTLNAMAGDRLPASPKWIASLGVQHDFALAGRPMFVRADSSYRGTFYGDLAQTPLTEAGGYVRVDAKAGMLINNVNVELFVNNLTNVDDFVWRGISNADAGFGQIMRPRTVGLQLGFTF